jgi:hypothetical protein
MSGYITMIFTEAGGYGTVTGIGTNVTGLSRNGGAGKTGLIVSGKSVPGHEGRGAGIIVAKATRGGTLTMSA